MAKRPNAVRGKRTLKPGKGYRKGVNNAEVTRIKFTRAKFRRAFFLNISAGEHATSALDSAGLDRRAYNRLKKDKPLFRAEVELAEAQGIMTRKFGGNTLEHAQDFFLLIIWGGDLMSAVGHFRLSAEDMTELKRHITGFKERLSHAGKIRNKGYGETMSAADHPLIWHRKVLLPMILEACRAQEDKVNQF